MSDNQTNSTVLVTGVSGYLGQQCAAELLRQGYDVRGTVRSLAKADLVRSALAKVTDRADDLVFVEADLLNDLGWADAMADVDFVLHVASPFIMGEPNHPDELIKPAVEGTTRVLNAAMAAGVQRTVLTSSTVAINSDRTSGTSGPGDWADPDNVGTYAKSKILAERAAWDLTRAQTGPDVMELTVINPGGIMGPSLTGETTGASTAMIADMIGGKMPMVPDISISMADVRDVAKMHVAAMTNPQAPGRRFVVASEKPIKMIDAAAALKRAGYEKVSTRRAPTLLLKMMAPFNSDVKGMISFLGKSVEIDNSETRAILRWEPTPFETSLTDMAASIS